MNFDSSDIEGLKVTVMGLGLHGGGLSSARFFARRGAQVTVTDLREEEVLAPSLEALDGEGITFILGRHREEDFRYADIVIKNPAVPSNSPYLTISRRVETDISVFLQLNKQPVIGITGSKGKSTIASAVHHVLKRIYPQAKLGGNITVSPLTFLDKDFLSQPAGEAPVVLELSSWQLADLRGRGVLSPHIAIVSNLLRDHMDRYLTMAEYAADKRVLLEEQEKGQYCILNHDDSIVRHFTNVTKAEPLFFSSRSLPPDISGLWLSPRGEGFFCRKRHTVQVLTADPFLPGPHNRVNLLAAGGALFLYSVPPRIIREGLKDFPGVEHRLEYVGEAKGVRFYNDSAATIPDATAEALKSFSAPIILIMGGNDKNLDFSVLRSALGKPLEVLLLKGTASDKIIPLLKEEARDWSGPFDSLEAVLSRGVQRLRETSSQKEPGILLFSPGATSFGMFLNEFERGRKFKEAAAPYLDRKR